MTGVMNAADYYGLEELRKSCVGFVQCCINVDTVCALLATAERYIQYKCTKSLVQKVNHSCVARQLLMIGSFPRSGAGICRRTRKWSAQFGIVHAASSTRRPPRSMQRRTQSRRIYQISGETCQLLIWLLCGGNEPLSLPLQSARLRSCGPRSTATAIPI